MNVCAAIIFVVIVVVVVTVKDREMQDGMKNEQGQVETWILLNACKQSELNWSSGKGKVLECDQSE